LKDGKWQPLRPHEPANQGQRRVGLTELHFGPEIAFAHEMAKAWPDETIGIIKFSIGGTSVLAWKPDWSKEDATRIEGIPDDLTDYQEPKNLPPGRPGAWLVLKAQFDAQKAIPHSKMVILRNVEKHPKNVHFNAAGQLEVGRLFAEAFLK